MIGQVYDDLDHLLILPAPADLAIQAMTLRAGLEYASSGSSQTSRTTSSGTCLTRIRWRA